MALEWMSFADRLGLGLLVLSTIVYHAIYHVYSRRHPLRTVRGKIHLYRRTWIKRILDNNEPVLAIQASRNQIMTASFLASSSLLALAFLANFVAQGDPAELGFGPGSHVRAKVLLMMGVVGFGFAAFLQALRDLNLFTTLIGADMDLIAHIEQVDGLTYLANVANRAADRYTYGQRAFLYTLPMLAWLYHSWLFVALTAIVAVYAATNLDFQQWRQPARFRRAAAKP